jgi:hypothetical protein
MTPIVALLEKASGPSPDIMIEAWKYIFGPEPDSQYDGRAWRASKPTFSPIWDEYIKARCVFLNYIQAGAFLDAAKLLTPRFPHLLITKELWDGNNKATMASIHHYEDGRWLANYDGLAADTASAICIASILAHEANHDRPC